MRDFKKFFFTSLLQLTILANVFRQNSRYSNLINDSNSNLFLTSDQNNTTLGQLDLILLRHSTSHFNQFNDTTQSNLNNYYRTKETLAYQKDLHLINLLNRYNLSSTFTNFNQNPILLLPASFLNSSSNNQKDISDLTETRLLLNSIELNFNNPTLKKEFEMDIELQALLEQDIDLGVHKYYNTESLTKFNDIVKSNKFESNSFELEFKNEDILTTTKYIQEEDLAEDLNLFVEEDTGELVLIPCDQETNRHSCVKLQTNTSSQSQSNATKRGLSYGNRSIFDPLPNEVIKPPCEVHDLIQPPLFLSEVSVSKTLENLNHENDSNNNNIVDSLLSFNDTLLNDFFSSNDESSTQNYLSYYEQTPQIITSSDSTIKFNNTNTSAIDLNQSNLLDDQFPFEDQFLKEFEANLDKYGVSELTSTTSVETQQIRNNQTIGGYSNDKSPIYISEQKMQSSSLQQNESEPLIDQISINDFFKMFENPTNETNANNTNVAFSNAPQSFIIDANKLNTSNDDEAKILNIFKQESIEINDSPNQNLISTINLPHLTQTEELTAALRGFQHNHTYLDGARSSNDSEVYHPYSYKNKLKKMLKNMNSEETNQTKHQESRDQLLLQENRIYASLNQVVESTADEFNELVKELQLTSEQLTIIKDIRRRGKNKVAAQICRKRKIDSIESLKEDVDHLNDLKTSLDSEHDILQEEINEITKKFDDLYKELMGDNNHEMNDAMVAYMNNLKGQVIKSQTQTTKVRSSLLRSIIGDQSDDTNSYDLDESSNQSSQLNDDDDDDDDEVIQTNPFEAIKKFKKY